MAKLLEQMREAAQIDRERLGVEQERVALAREQAALAGELTGQVEALNRAGAEALDRLDKAQLLPTGVGASAGSGPSDRPVLGPIRRGGGGGEGGSGGGGLRRVSFDDEAPADGAASGYRHLSSSTGGSEKSGGGGSFAPVSIGGQPGGKEIVRELSLLGRSMEKALSRVERAVRDAAPEKGGVSIGLAVRARGGL